MKVLTSLKLCSSCNQTKSLSEFHKDKSVKSGFTNRCKLCTSKRHSKRQKELKNTLVGTFTQMLNWVRKRAKKKDREYNLTLDFLIELYTKQAGKCALTDIPLTYGSNIRGNFSTISIDRIDSSKGYTKDNVQFLCNGVNTMKLTLKTNDFIELCTKVANKSKNLKKE